MNEDAPKKNILVLTILPVLILSGLAIAAYVLFGDLLVPAAEFEGEIVKFEPDVTFKMSSLQKSTSSDEYDESEEKISKLSNKKKGVVKVVYKIIVLTDQGEKYNVFIPAKDAPEIIEGDWLVKKDNRCFVYDEKPKIRNAKTNSKFEIYPIKITSEKRK